MSEEVAEGHNLERGRGRREKRGQRKERESHLIHYNFDWVQVLVLTRRDFHDDWGRILVAMESQLETKLIINSFQPDKAILKCPNEELARLLSLNKEWVTFSDFMLKVELWNKEKHGYSSVVPSWGDG